MTLNRRALVSAALVGLLMVPVAASGTGIWICPQLDGEALYTDQAAPGCHQLQGSSLQPSTAVRTINASGEYRMGDHDTREDAIRLAIEDAKRHVLEQVATYLESVTEVTTLQVASDEIRTYTAGIVLIQDQQISTRLEGNAVVVHVDLTSQVDPEEVRQAILALRENEDAKSELIALRAENEHLRQQLDTTSQALATATSPDQVQALSQQRQALLNQIQSNTLVSQTWTDWVLVAWPSSPLYGVGVYQVQSLLTQAMRLHPANPHLRIIQRVIPAQPMPRQAGAVLSPKNTPPLAPLPPTLHQVYPPHQTYAGPHVHRMPYMAQPSFRAPQTSGGHGHHSR